MSAQLTLATLAFAVGPATAQEVVELPFEDRIVDAEFPEVYRLGDGVRDWELLTRVTSIGFDAQGNLHIGDWSGGDLSVLVATPAPRDQPETSARPYKMTDIGRRISVSSSSPRSSGG